MRKVAPKIRFLPYTSFCVRKISKNRSISDDNNTNIWGHSWSKFGYLTPQGDLILYYPLLFGN